MRVGRWRGDWPAWRYSSAISSLERLTLRSKWLRSKWLRSKWFTWRYSSAISSLERLTGVSDDDLRSTSLKAFSGIAATIPQRTRVATSHLSIV